MDTIEDNKLIAAFMGIKPNRFEINHYSHGFNLFSNPSLEGLTWPRFSAWDTEELVMAELYKEAKYATSWDWLMPVVEKIRSLGSKIVINILPECSGIQSSCYISNEEYDYPWIHITQTGRTAIEAVYCDIVAFIKHYNKQNGSSKE